MSNTNEPPDDPVDAVEDAARDAKHEAPPPTAPPTPAPAPPSSMDTGVWVAAGEEVTGVIDGSAGCRLQGAQGVGGGLRGREFCCCWGCGGGRDRPRRPRPGGVKEDVGELRPREAAAAAAAAVAVVVVVVAAAAAVVFAAAASTSSRRSGGGEVVLVRRRPRPKR